ncbi:HIT family protein [Micrococcoides hystricis]|uniref:HIT family protein n=1 Tax=Micrococcoides hystricis TaxID=1572761 RepID=A0ABV6PBR8_9MICC
MSTVFTKIIEGELPGRFVWKDDTAVAFLSIGPLAPGHTLVVPREEVDYWTDLPEETVAHLMKITQRIGVVQREAFGAARAGVMIAGFEVPHTHIHVWPSNSLHDFDLDRVDNHPDPQVMDEAAEKIRAGLRDAGFGEFVPEA